MGQRIGTAEVGVEVLDAQAIAGLRAIEAQFESTTRKIDRMRADAEFGADVSEFDQKMANLRRQIREWQGKRADAKIDVDGTKFSTKIKKAQAELRRLDGQKAVMELELRGEDKIRAALARKEKLEAENAKAQADRIKREDALLNQQHARKMSNMREEMKLRQQSLAGRMFSEEEKLSRQRARDNGLLDRLTDTYKKLNKQLDDIAHERARGNKTLAEENDLQERQLKLLARINRVKTEINQHTREQTSYDKDLEMVPRLQMRYAQLARTIEALNAKKRQGSQLDRQTTLLKIGATVAQMERLKETLERVGSPVEIDVALNPGRHFGEAVRRAITMPNSGVINRSRALGGAIGDQVERGFKRRFTKERISDALIAPFAAAGRGLSALGNMSVRLGPFTTSVRGALLALTLLGPVVVDVIGSLGALVGSVGSAALGLGALTTAIVGGGAPALLGMGLVVKDVAQEFQAVKKAQKAYDSALQKDNYKLASKKLKELHNVLGNVSEETAKQVGSSQALGRAWDKATAPGRASIWKTLGQGIESAGKMLPMFAKNTNAALDVAGAGIRSWMRGLSSDAGRGILNTLMDNFTKSLGPALSGLGHLTAYLGKLGASASRHLPKIMGQFRDWAKGLSGAADNTALLNAKVDRWMNSLRTVGRFLVSGGRWMKSFFGGGVTAGNKFLDTMTATMDRWTAFNNTVAGKQKLGDFFNDSVDGAKALYGAIAPIATIFVGWATAISPWVSMFLDGVGAVGQLVSGILEVTALQSSLSALIATLGALWAVNKIGGAVRAISGFVAALFGMSRANTVAAASSNAAAAASTRQAAAAAAAATATRGAAAATAAAAASSRGAAVVAAAPVTRRPIPAQRTSPGGVIIPPGAARNVDEAAKKTTGLAKAGKAATASLGALGALVGGGWMAGAALVTAAAGFAIYKYATRTRDWEKAQVASNKAMAAGRSIMANTGNATLDLAISANNAAQSSMNLKDAQTAFYQAESRANGVLKKNGSESKAYAAAQDEVARASLNLTQARLSDIQQQEAVRKQYQTTRRTITEGMKAYDDGVKQAQNAVNGLGDQKATDRGGKISQVFKNLQKEAKAAGVSVSEVMDAKGWRDGGLREKVDQYTASLDQLKSKQAEQRTAQNNAALGYLNTERAMNKLPPIAEKYSASLGKLSREAPAIARRIATSMKFADPNVAGKVSQAAGSAISKNNSAARQSLVLKILADDSSARSKINRLNALALKDKLVDIKANNAEGALRAIGRVASAKVRDKVVNIMASDSDAKSKISQLKALGIPDKMARMLGNNADALAKAAQANNTKLRSLIQMIMRNWANTGSGPPVPSTTQTVHRRFVGASGSGHDSFTRAVGGFTARAAGGPTASTQRAQDRAEGRMYAGMLPMTSTGALQGGAKIAGGARVLVGEEPHHPEIVISTNPSYRDSNIEYLKMAASYLGVGTEMTAMTGLDDRDGVRAFSTGGGSGMAKRTAKKPTKKKKKTNKWRSPSVANAMNKVDAAELAEDKYEFDTAHKIDRLVEPESFLDESTDPKTGMKVYTVNNKRVEDWQNKLNEVAGDYKVLQGLNTTTNEAITNAESVVAEVKKVAKKNMSHFQKAIDHEEAVIKNHSKDKDKTTVNNARKRLSDANSKYNYEKTNLDNAKDADKQLDEDAESSRRRRVGYDDNYADYSGKSSPTGSDSVKTKAAADAAAQNDSSSDTGTAMTPGQQAISNAERITALTEAGLPGGVGSAVEAYQQQLAAQQTRLQEGMDMVASGNMAGNDIVASAASAIKGLQDQIAGQSAGQTAIMKAETIAALTDAGLAGGAGSMAQAIQGQIDAQNVRLGEGMSMLSDSITSNDSEGNSIVQGAANAIKGLSDTLKELNGSGTQSIADAASAITNGSTSLADVFKQYSNNFSAPGSLMGNRQVMAAMAPSAAPATGLVGGEVAGRSARGAGDTIIYMGDQTFETQPEDPHLWARQQAFELKAAL